MQLILVPIYICMAAHGSIDNSDLLMHGCLSEHCHVPRGTFYIQYETLEELGEGAFGKALKCRRRRDNQIFVVKIMHESKMSAKAIEEVMHCLVN